MELSGPAHFRIGRLGLPSVGLVGILQPRLTAELSIVMPRSCSSSRLSRYRIVPASRLEMIPFAARSESAKEDCARVSLNRNQKLEGGERDVPCRGCTGCFREPRGRVAQTRSRDSLDVSDDAQVSSVRRNHLAENWSHFEGGGGGLKRRKADKNPFALTTSGRDSLIRPNILTSVRNHRKATTGE